MTDTETRLRDVFERQAALLGPPAMSVEDLLSQPVVLPPAARRTRWTLRVAAGALAAGAIVGAVVLVQDSSDHVKTTTPADSPAGDGAEAPVADAARTIRLETPQVHLDAVDLTVTIGDRTYRPTGRVVPDALQPGPGDVAVHSDPGWSSYTTLEVTWLDDGIEMRVFLYFASDGADWWISEMRTYNGDPSGEWITSTGEFLRTPLGRPFEGDFHEGKLDITGMSLQPFLDPVAAAKPPPEG
jgi:hypothetical protein